MYLKNWACFYQCTVFHDYIYEVWKVYLEMYIITYTCNCTVSQYLSCSHNSYWCFATSTALEYLPPSNHDLAYFLIMIIKAMPFNQSMYVYGISNGCPIIYSGAVLSVTGFLKTRSVNVTL